MVAHPRGKILLLIAAMFVLVGVSLVHTAMPPRVYGQTGGPVDCDGDNATDPAEAGEVGECASPTSTTVPVFPIVVVPQAPTQTVSPSPTVTSTATPIPLQSCGNGVSIPSNEACPSTSVSATSVSPGQITPLIISPSSTTGTGAQPAPQTAAAPATSTATATTTTTIATPTPTPSPTTSSAPPTNVAPPLTATLTPTPAPAGTPPSTPSSAPAPAASPTTGTFGNVDVTSGNDIPRIPGRESQPPIGVAISGMTVTLTNNTVDPLDLTGTAIIDVSPGVQVTNVQVSSGTAVMQGNQVVWSNFSLSSGQSASAVVSMVTTGGAVSSAPAIQSVNVEAVDSATGERVAEQTTPGGGVPVSALASALTTTAAPAPAAAAPAVAAAAPGVAAPVAAAPVTAARAVAAAPATPAVLPHTGDPVVQNRALLILLLFGAAAVALGLFVQRRPRSEVE